MKSILMQLALYMLLFDSVYLARRIRQELQHYRAGSNRTASMPRDGSLHGIDAKGNTKTPNIDADRHLEGQGHLLVFVIHRQGIMKEIQFWNRVIDLASGFRPGPAAPIQYWGICDDGLSCNSFQSVAHFSILGHLDPYEMHIVAQSNANHEALLYDRSMRTKARIAIGADPLAEATDIMKEVK